MPRLPSPTTTKITFEAAKEAGEQLTGYLIDECLKDRENRHPPSPPSPSSTTPPPSPQPPLSPTPEEEDDKLSKYKSCYPPSPPPILSTTPPLSSPLPPPPPPSPTAEEKENDEVSKYEHRNPPSPPPSSSSAPSSSLRPLPPLTSLPPLLSPEEEDDDELPCDDNGSTAVSVPRRRFFVVMIFCLVILASSMPTASGAIAEEGLIATGITKDQSFIDNISTPYKSGNTAVDLKLNTSANVLTKLTYEEALPGIKTSVSVNIPDQKSGKVDVLYRNYHAAVNSSVGFTLSPLLDFNAAIGNEKFSLGGEVAFDTASASFIKCNAGITFNEPDFFCRIDSAG